MESITNQNKNTIIQANFGENSRQVVPMIAGVEITTDSEGRFNLNALHRASGAEKKNGPSYWLALDTTKSLISELEQQLSDTEISVVVAWVCINYANLHSYLSCCHKVTFRPFVERTEQPFVTLLNHHRNRDSCG